MQAGSRFGIAAALIMLLGSHAARAQHVVTEQEAGKLTLEALTAAPPPPRPAYRAYYRPAMSLRTVHGRVLRTRMAAWHPAAHRVVHHRRA